MGLTAEQLEERRAYLGGTDAAALAGVNPPGWAQPIDVYLDKVGLSEPRPSSPAMRLGTLLEPVVAELFTQATGIKLRRWSRPVRSREWPWMGGHLDRWASDGAVFEAKWSLTKEGWGESLPLDGTDEAPTIIPGPGDPDYQPVVPPHYMVQVQHYLAVTERPLAYLGALLGYGDFRWYAIWRDELVIGNLVELERRFWHENVLAGVPPDPDGSASYGRHLRRQLAADDGSEAVMTPEQWQLASEYREARENLAGMARELEERAQRLQLSMGEHARLVGPGVTITWRQNKPSRRVAWEELATEQLRLGMPPDQWPATKKAQAELVREHAQALGLLTEEPGARPFRVKFDSDEEGA